MSIRAKPMRPRRSAWRYLVVVAIVATSCTAGSPELTSDAPAGFWLGLWHGLISFVTLVVGIFDSGVRVYEVDNTGGWYDLGFLLGVTSLWGHRLVTHRRRRDAGARALDDQAS